MGWFNHWAGAHRQAPQKAIPIQPWLSIHVIRSQACVEIWGLRPAPLFFAAQWKFHD